MVHKVFSICCILIITIQVCLGGDDSQEAAKHCTIGNRRILHGAKIGHPTECMQLVCSDGEVLLHQCTSSTPEPNCRITPGLVGHPFPECCGSSVCIVGK